MTFVKFEGTNKRQEDRITVTGHSSFGFPTKFYNDNKINEYKYVTLFFDEENKEVGFYFHNDEAEKHRFSILKSKQGFGGSIVASSFFKNKSLDSKNYRGRYEWGKVNQVGVGELYVIKLKIRVENPVKNEV